MEFLIISALNGVIYGLLLFQRGERGKAMPYLEASAARGEPRAQYLLGLALFNGDNVARDWVRAYALVSLAQQAGLAQAASALPQMDKHIPIEDRRKSVVLAGRLAAEARAARDRQAASAELARGTVVPAAPEIVAAEHAVSEAVRAAGAESPASAGADYTRKTPPPSAAATKAPPSKAGRPSPSPAPSRSGPWRVQLGAFGVAGNADALWARVRSRPELAGHGKMLVPAGRLTKLQAVGFATKTEADVACSRLSAGGFSCLTVRD